MVFGKDKSNPLIVDSLLKTIRFSIHLVVYNEDLAIPEQTATGKGTSNPLMLQQVAAAGVPEAAKDAPVADKGALAIPASLAATTTSSCW
ncbi:hypothetical protein Tco_0363539 [Tanacetum coccineum]